MSHPIRLLRNQASQLIEKGMITTTHAKALKVRGYVSGLIAKTRKKGITSRRLLEASLFGNQSIKKTLELPDNVKIKLYRLGFRSGDQAPLTRLILETPKVETKKPTDKKTK